MSDVEFQSFFHEDGQSRYKRVESPIEAKLANVDGVNRNGCQNAFPGDAVVLEMIDLIKCLFIATGLKRKRTLLSFPVALSCNKVREMTVHR